MVPICDYLLTIGRMIYFPLKKAIGRNYKRQAYNDDPILLISPL